MDAKALRFLLQALAGSGKNRLVYRRWLWKEPVSYSTCSKWRPLCLYTIMLVVEPSAGQSFCQNLVFVAERRVYKDCSDVWM